MPSGIWKCTVEGLPLWPWRQVWVLLSPQSLMHSCWLALRSRSDRASGPVAGGVLSGSGGCKASGLMQDSRAGRLGLGGGPCGLAWF